MQRYEYTLNFSHFTTTKSNQHSLLPHYTLERKCIFIFFFACKIHVVHICMQPTESMFCHRFNFNFQLKFLLDFDLSEENLLLVYPSSHQLWPGFLSELMKKAAAQHDASTIVFHNGLMCSGLQTSSNPQICPLFSGFSLINENVQVLK